MLLFSGLVVFELRLLGLARLTRMQACGLRSSPA
jgi:hypothetical protein